MARSRRAFSSRGASRGHRDAGGGRATPPRAGGISAGRRRGFAGGARPYDYAAYEHEPATPDYMRRLFARYHVELDDGRLGQFWRYYELLREHNARLDLTRIMGIEATVLKHFVDSLWPDRLSDLRGPVLDIGTGPGFPGGPLAVMRPDRPAILAESRGKRVEFLTMVKKELGLAQVTVYPHSVREDSPFYGATEGGPLSTGTGEGTRWAVRDVVTRALETIPPTLARVRMFVPPGGRVYFWKGPQCGQEITEAQSTLKTSYKMVLDEKYDLPGTDQHRRLVAFERRAEN